MMSVKRRLLGLAARHIVLGIIARLLAPIELPNVFGLVRLPVVPLVASALCQAFLLAVWGATSSGSPWRRLAGLAAGAVYLEALLPSDFRRELLGMSTITVAVVTATLLVIRMLGVRLNPFTDSAQPTPPETEGFRLSIRGLMLVTAAVALLSAGARALQEEPHRLVLLMAVWAMCFVTVGLVALWAVLGLGRPLRRGVVVFVLSPILGACFAFASQAHRAGWVYILLIMLLYPTLLLSSLLVVRSCGYRFVRRAASSSKPPDGGGGSLLLKTPASRVTAPE
jgi:hypothetical protein